MRNGACDMNDPPDGLLFLIYLPNLICQVIKGLMAALAGQSPRMRSLAACPSRVPDGYTFLPLRDHMGDNIAQAASFNASHAACQADCACLSFNSGVLRPPGNACTDRSTQRTAYPSSDDLFYLPLLARPSMD
jgi:hypothetical protein